MLTNTYVQYHLTHKHKTVIFVKVEYVEVCARKESGIIYLGKAKQNSTKIYLFPIPIMLCTLHVLPLGQQVPRRFGQTDLSQHFQHVHNTFIAILLPQLSNRVQHRSVQKLFVHAMIQQAELSKVLS